jgi:predicted deacylase
MSLEGFEDQVAFSFYFHSYRWAYFWRGIIRASPLGNADLCYKASLAAAMGYLANTRQSPGLQMKATELSSHTVAAVHSVISRGSKAEAAGMLNVLAAMGVYNVWVSSMEDCYELFSLIYMIQSIS